MKANELMIGDWVFDVECKPRRILSLDYGGNVEIDTTEVGHSDADTIIPIPLAKEILEKNGLKRDQFYIGYEDVYLWIINNVDVFYLIEDYKGETFTLCKLYYDYEESTQIIDICPISYVHELQHAFRLCGIKKEIEL